MKTKYLIVLASVFMLFAACSDPLTQPVDFEVSVANADQLTFVDTAYVIKAGTEMEFNFKGEPDFIAFTYDRFLPTNATLKFSTTAAWGNNIENTLSVFISDNFEGLLMDNFSQDSQNIKNHNWKDITSLANLPVSANNKLNAEIDLNEYRAKKAVIAFRYKTSVNTDWQPSWLISDLEIENTRITDNSNVSNNYAATMGFAPFDMLNEAEAYRNEYVSGVWNSENADAMQIRQTSRNNELNEDWLISKPTEIPIGLVEKSVAKGVKNNTLNVDSYTHKFDDVGEFVVKFKASNHNYRYHSATERVININVID